MTMCHVAQVLCIWIDSQHVGPDGAVIVAQVGRRNWNVIGIRLERIE